MDNFLPKREQTEENVLAAIRNSGDLPNFDARELSQSMISLESVRFALVRKHPPCIGTIPAEYITDELLDAALNSEEVPSQRGNFLRPLALRHVPMEMVTYERLLRAVKQNACVLELGWRFLGSDANGVYPKEAVALALAATESEHPNVACIPTRLLTQALRAALAESEEKSAGTVIAVSNDPASGFECLVRFPVVLEEEEEMELASLLSKTKREMMENGACPDTDEEVLQAALQAFGRGGDIAPVADSFIYL